MEIIAKEEAKWNSIAGKPEDRKNKEEIYEESIKDVTPIFPPQRYRVPENYKDKKRNIMRNLLFELPQTQWKLPNTILPRKRDLLPKN